MEAQVPLSTVVAFVVAGYSLVLTIAGFLARTLYANDKKENERRIAELTKRLETSEADARAATAERNALRDRLHADEVQTTKLEGKVNLVESNHDKLVADVDEITRTMVTKDLFDTAMQYVRTQLSQILTTVSRYPSTREMQRVVPTIPSEPPKR